MTLLSSFYMSAKTGDPESYRIRHAWLRVPKQPASALFSQYPFIHSLLFGRALFIYSGSESWALSAEMQDALISSEPHISTPSLPRTDSEDDLLRTRDHASVDSSSSAAESRDFDNLPSSPCLGSCKGPRSSRKSYYRPTSDNTNALSPFDAIVEPESRSRAFRGIAKNDVPSAAHEYNDLSAEDHSVRDSRTGQTRSNGEMYEIDGVSDQTRLLQRHTMALWLISMFAAVTIFAWTITCVLCYKPIQFGTYYDRTGRYTRKQYDGNDRWRKLSRVLMSLVSNVSIPVTSAICARAVAVYTQSCSKLRKPTLTMRQTLALADKGWTDTAVLSGLLRPDANRRMGSPLLILSALLFGLGRNEPISISAIYVKIMHQLSLFPSYREP